MGTRWLYWEECLNGRQSNKNTVPGKAYLSVYSIALLAYPKLEARGLIGEWWRSTIRFGLLKL